MPLDGPRTIGFLFGCHFPGRISHWLLVFYPTGLLRGQQRRSELNVGKALIAEAWIAFVVLPTCGRSHPTGGVIERSGGHTITRANGGVQCARTIPIVVARETAILTRPRGNFAFQKFNRLRFRCSRILLR